MSPEEDRTHDAVDSEPKHYQLSYYGPPANMYKTIKGEIKGFKPVPFVSKQPVALFCFCL